MDAAEALTALDLGNYLPAMELLSDKPSYLDDVPIHLAKRALERGADAITNFLVYGGFTGLGTDDLSELVNTYERAPGELLLSKWARWQFRYGLSGVIADTLPGALPEWVGNRSPRSRARPSWVRCARKRLSSCATPSTRISERASCSAVSGPPDMPSTRPLLGHHR